MALPNMAMIPSGYKPTKLYSVLPTPTYGSEEVLNGNFATDSDWIKGAGWTISGGVCVGTSVAISVAVYQTPLIIGKKYRITVDLVSVISGGIKERIGTSSNPIERTTAGTYSFERVADSTVLGVIAGSNGFTGTIDNVSVKEVLVGDADFDVLRATPATRVNQQGLIETPEFILSGELVTNGDFSDGGTDWILGSGWTIEENKATQDNSTPNTGDIIQTNVSVVGKQYKITFDLDVTSGTVSALIGGHNLFNTSGTKTFFKTANATNFAFRNYANFIGSIDNVSIVEVERENIPRLDYTDGGCPVLLTEPQSTNLITDSQDLASLSAAGNAVVTSNAITSPSGLLDADEITFDGTIYGRVEASISATIGQPYTISLYLKNKDLSDTTQVWIGFSQGGQGQFVTITDEWQRYDITTNADGTTEYPRIQFSGTGSLYAWGFQVENLPYSTSYIPTNGSAVTRNQDIVNNAGTSATYNSTEGVLFVEIQGFENSNKSRYISLSDGSALNSLRIFYYNDGGTIFFRKNVNGVQTSIATITSIIQSELNKIAIRYNSTNFDIFSNGIKISTNLDSNAFPSGTLNKLSFNQLSNIDPFFGKTSQVQVFNTALSDFDLQNLTSNATAYATYETMRTSLNFNIQ